MAIEMLMEAFRKDPDAVRNEMASHSLKQIAEQYGMSTKTVENVELLVGVYCMRYCQSHRTYHPADHFDPGVGQRRFRGACRNSHSPRLAEVRNEEGEGGLMGYLNMRMSPATGPVSYWVQRDLVSMYEEELA